MATDTHETDTTSRLVAEGMAELVRHAIPSARDITFTGLTRSAGGLSRENWSFDTEWIDERGPHAHRLMLMRDASGTLLKTERRREFDVLRALEGSAVAAPAVFWLDPDGQFLGAPSLIMERVSGSCEYKVLNGARPLEERLRLAHAFIRLLTDIQAIDWQARAIGPSLGVPESAPATIALDEWEAEYRRAQLEPHPELDYVLAWMRRTAPQSHEIVLVHGDFKPGNALIEDTQITAKLDWETAHLGDPLEDLGWITNPVRRREHQIAGHWERAHIVEAYTRMTGRAVDDTALTWWNVFSCWKLAVIQLTAVNEFVSGRYNRVFQTPAWLFRPMLQMMECAA